MNDKRCDGNYCNYFAVIVESMAAYVISQSSWKWTTNRWKLDWRSWRSPWDERRLRESMDSIYLFYTQNLCILIMFCS